MAQEMQVETAAILLGIRLNNFTRETLKIMRDHIISNSNIIITNIEDQLQYSRSEKEKNKLNIRIAEEKKKIEHIKQAYSVLKSYYIITHGKRAKNYGSNAYKGVSRLFGRVRKGVSGLASRMYTRNGNGGASEGSRKSRESASEESKESNENKYTRSRRESGNPYGNWSRSNRGFNRSHRYEEFSQIFRTKQDEKIDEYLQVLGLELKPESFALDVIRKAYKKYAKKTHPNGHPTRRLLAEKEFKSVNEANQQLMQLLENGYIYSPPQGIIPSASPMHSKAASLNTRSSASKATSPPKAASPKAAPPKAASPKARARSPKRSYQETESHDNQIKTALSILHLNPNFRYSARQILQEYMSMEPSEEIDIAFNILYQNDNAKPPRTQAMVEAIIEDKKRRYKDSV